MESQVEKMYENAGVKYYKEICAIKNVIDKVGNKECYFEVCCSSCPLNKTSFTAEKQIAILQFCLKWGQVHILKGIDDEYRIENSCYRQGYQPTVADAIANYINEKWENLTPEERKQIKEILSE